MKLKKIDNLRDNRFVKALRAQLDHREIIEQMKTADSDEKILFLAKKMIDKEEVHREMLNNLIKELYEGERQGQHTNNDD